MKALSTEGIYRAMLEEDGMPKRGAAATMLGIRVGTDIVPDAAGAVHLPAFAPGEKNGLSCAATIDTLPRFTLPTEWGGLNKRTTIWIVDDADLKTELVAGDDSVVGRNRHISIGPRLTMDYNDFVRAIEATRPVWTKVIKT